MLRFFDIILAFVGLLLLTPIFALLLIVGFFSQALQSSVNCVLELTKNRL